MDTKTKIKVLMARRDKNIAYLAEQLGKSQPNMSKQFKVCDFRESDLKSIANALGCDLNINFLMRDTGEEI